MCIGPLAPRMPAPPKPQGPAPSVKAAEAPAEYVDPEKIKEQQGDDDLIDTKKKKALEIKKVKEGVKEFGAIDAKTMPSSPEGGVSAP